MATKSIPASVPEPTPDPVRRSEPASVPDPTPHAMGSSKAATASVSATTTPTATTPLPATPTAPMPAASDCRDVRDEAKRANRNARCQNAYRPLHGALSLIEVGSNAREPTHLKVTVVSAASFLDSKAKVPC